MSSRTWDSVQTADPRDLNGFDASTLDIQNPTKRLNMLKLTHSTSSHYSNTSSSAVSGSFRSQYSEFLAPRICEVGCTSSHPSHSLHPPVRPKRPRISRARAGLIPQSWAAECELPNLSDPRPRPWLTRWGKSTTSSGDCFSWCSFVGSWTITRMSSRNASTHGTSSALIPSKEHSGTSCRINDLRGGRHER